MSKNYISNLRHVSRKLIRELGMLELNKFEINNTPQHWHALIEIHNEPNITITKLGSLLLLCYSTTLRIVNSFIKDGLITSQNGLDKRENCLKITEKGLQAIKKIDEFSNAKVLGALQFLTLEDQKQIFEAIDKYATALEKNRILYEQVKLHTLSTSRTLRKQIINLVEDIQKNEFGLPITEAVNICILKAETEFYYNNSYNFWYATDATGKVIGCIGLKKIDDNNAELKKFFVHQDFRGKGVAKKLMQVLLKAAVKHQFKFLVLGTVDKLHAAHKFYTRYGFSPIKQQDLPQNFNVCFLDTLFFRGEVQSLTKIV